MLPATVLDLAVFMTRLTRALYATFDMIGFFALASIKSRARSLLRSQLQYLLHAKLLRGRPEREL